jgi:hypothetical protein
MVRQHRPRAIPEVQLGGVLIVLGVRQSHTDLWVATHSRPLVCHCWLCLLLCICDLQSLAQQLWFTDPHCVCNALQLCNATWFYGSRMTQ